MTAIELREELFREMNPLLDSETAMKKIIAYVKGLVVAQNKKSGVAARKGWAAAAKKAHAAGEDKQVTVDDFAGAWATMDDDMLDAALAKFHKDEEFADMDKELYTPEEAYELTMKDIKAIYDDATV